MDVGVAPLAVAQAAGSVLGSAPGRLTGEMCARISVAEIKQPLRFCNRYVSAAAARARTAARPTPCSAARPDDLGGALGTIDAYTGKPPHVTGVNVLLKVHRGTDQAFIRDISLPPRVRPGQRVKVRVALQRVRGGKLTRTYTMAIPRDARPGRQHPAPRRPGRRPGRGRLHDDHPRRRRGGGRGRRPGPATLDELAEQVRGTERFDGVSLRLGRVRGEAFRDDDFRISGQAETTVRVTAAAERDG